MFSLTFFYAKNESDKDIFFDFLLDKNESDKDDFFGVLLDKNESDKDAFFDVLLDKNDSDRFRTFILDFSTDSLFFILSNSDVFCVQDRHVDMSICPTVCLFCLFHIYFSLYLSSNKRAKGSRWLRR